MRTAVLRGLLRNEQGEYVSHCRRIADYTLDEQITHLLAAMPRGWTWRADAIQAAARYLGFRRTGSALDAAFNKAITVALRRHRLEAHPNDLDWIRK